MVSKQQEQPMCEIYQKPGHGITICWYNPKNRGKQVQNRDNVQANQVYPLNQKRENFRPRRFGGRPPW